MLCLLQSILSSQDMTPVRIRSLHLEGNQSISTNTILQALAVREGEVYTENQIRNAVARVLELYSTEGYLDAFIDSIVIERDTLEPAVDVRYVFIEGKRSVVHSLTFVGDSLFSPREIALSMTTTLGSPLNFALLENDIYELLKLCDKKGYPFAVISFEHLSRTEEEGEYRWDIVLSITKNYQVSISEMKFDGLRTTKEEVAFRETRLRRGQLYTASLPPLVKKRLERLQVFSSVSLPELYVTAQEISPHVLSGGFKVTVTEGSTIAFDGMIGYMPTQAEQGKGTFTGLVSLQFRNLFGTARKLATRWYRERALTQEVELQYTEPWVFSVPVNISVGLAQRRQDSTYVRNHTFGTAEYMLSEEIALGATFTTISVHAIEGYGKRVLPSSWSVLVGASIKYDTRNSTHTPTEGVLYSTEYSAGTKHHSSFGTSPSTKLSTHRILFDGAFFTTLTTHQCITFDAHLRAYYAPSIVVSDLYLLGGATTLRGYREGQFTGSRIGWFNAEYRYLVAPRSFFFLFTNLGYYFQPALSAGVLQYEGYPVGYGGGVRLETAIGFLTVSFAFGKGDTFSTAKLHVRVSNEL